MKKVSIHRALAELKVLDAKIERAISEIEPTAIYQEGKKIGGHTSIEDFENSAKSSMDQATEFIKQKSVIKTAIVESNSKTKITINGKEMSVADVITHKSNIVFEKRLLEVLISKSNKSKGALIAHNEKVDANLQKLLEFSFGKDQTKVYSGDIDAISTPFKKSNSFQLFDPLKVDEKIKALQDKIMAFETEVDAALSESNAITMIEY